MTIKAYEKFNKRFSNQGTTNTANTNKQRVPTLKPQGVSGGGSYVGRPTCAKYGKKHEVKCLVGMVVFYGCAKGWHKLNDFPTHSSKGSDGNQASPSCSNSDSPNKSHFYAL